MNGEGVRILNLGAGVQSTTVYLLALEGRIPPFDYAIFADTQEEPQAVYHHLEWLQGLGGTPILIRTAGKLGDDLIRGKDGSGSGHHSIPAYTAPNHEERRLLTGCEKGIVPRECTKFYKINVVEQTIRQEILGILPRHHVPADVQVIQAFGISRDERIRANRIRERFTKHTWSKPEFPLLELGWIRAECQTYLRDRVPHVTPRSACVFCPYKSDREWKKLRDHDPEGWQRAVEVDHALRSEGSSASQGLHQTLYVHNQCIPLDLVQLRDDDRDGFFKFHCDEGMCGV